MSVKNYIGKTNNYLKAVYEIKLGLLGEAFENYSKWIESFQMWMKNNIDNKNKYLRAVYEHTVKKLFSKVKWVFLE